MTGYFRALDSFVAEPDGVPRAVLRGAVLPESDPVVQHDLNNGSLLFAQLDTGEDEKPPARKAPARSPAKPPAGKASS